MIYESADAPTVGLLTACLIVWVVFSSSGDTPHPSASFNQETPTHSVSVCLFLSSHSFSSFPIQPPFLLSPLFILPSSPSFHLPSTSSSSFSPSSSFMLQAPFPPHAPIPSLPTPPCSPPPLPLVVLTASRQGHLPCGWHVWISVAHCLPSYNTERTYRLGTDWSKCRVAVLWQVTEALRWLDAQTGDTEMVGGSLKVRLLFLVPCLRLLALVAWFPTVTYIEEMQKRAVSSLWTQSSWCLLLWYLL